MRLKLAAMTMFVAASAAQAQETREVIMQSLCKPEGLSPVYEPFGFELIQRAGTWEARVYPVKDAIKRVPVIVLEHADVRIVNSPNAGNVVITLAQTIEQEGRRYTVIALSEVVSGKPSGFSISLSSGAVGPDGIDSRESTRATCSFVNSDPYGRIAL